jgi:3-oxoacyl-[acyl-carrier-protein] synthase II
MASRRVVVTGMGLVSPLGNSPEALWDALLAGRSGVQNFASLPAHQLPTPFGAEAREFTGEVEQFGPLDKTVQRNIKKGLKLMCREIEMGVASAQLALAGAGMKQGTYNPERTGVSFGSDYIMTVPEEFSAGIRRCIDDKGRFRFEQWGAEGLGEVTPLWLLKYLPNMPASHIAIYNDLRGPSNSITLREASSNLAVGEAMNTIARGAADAILAGATGTRVHLIRTLYVMLQEQVADGSLAPEAASRPFDRDRSGMVLGEGAACLVLERAGAAARRGTVPLAVLLGGAAASEAHHLLHPLAEGAGMAECMRAALADARVAAGRVAHVYAHGTGTRSNDACEAAALARVLPHGPTVSASKSQLGHTLGAAGAIDAVLAVRSLGSGQVPPLGPGERPDPECPVQAALAPAQPHVGPAGDPARAVLVNAFAFGGHNAALLFGPAPAAGAGNAPGPGSARP